jgi:hypothetical protein
MVLGGEGLGVIQSRMDWRTQPRIGPLTLNPALPPEVVRVPENQHTTGCLAISSASSRVNFGASPSETGQTGDWNWFCARRGGPGEKLKC